MNTMQMPQTFLGCEVIDCNLPEDFRSELNTLTFNPVIKPQVRTQGLTAGKKGRCYWNANQMSQTIGGDTVYGWLIYRTLVDGLEVFRLYGHACWLTPEGKLVDVTNHLDGNGKKEDYVGFLPDQEIKLVLNAKTNEHVHNFWYVSDFDALPTCIASELTDYVDVRYKAFDEETSIRVHESVLSKLNDGKGSLVFVQGSFASFGVGMSYAMFDNPSPEMIDKVVNMLAPICEPVTKDTPVVFKQDCNFNITKALHRCFHNGLHLFKEYPAVEVFYASMKSPYDTTNSPIGNVTGDGTWETVLEFFHKPNFPNPSMKGKHEGLCMDQIPPSASFLDSLPLPKKPKQVKQLKKIADGYGLTLQEANLLSHPHFFPHPYLVKKAGEKVGRVKDHILLAC